MIDVIGIFLGAFLGAFFGFLFALAADRRIQNRNITRIRSETKKALSEELSENLKYLKGKRENIWPSDSRYTIHREPLRSFAMDSVVSSGNFSLLDIETQSKISNVYSKIREANLILESILGNLPTLKPNNSALQSLSLSLGGIHTKLQNEIPKVIESLTLT